MSGCVEKVSRRGEEKECVPAKHVAGKVWAWAVGVGTGGAGYRGGMNACVGGLDCFRCGVRSGGGRWDKRGKAESVGGGGWVI